MPLFPHALEYKSDLRYNFELFHLSLANFPAGGGGESETLLFLLFKPLFSSLLPAFPAPRGAIKPREAALGMSYGSSPAPGSV